MSNLVLRNVMEDDLPIFFKHQQDSEANQMAAFTSKDPNNWDGFVEHWNKILTNTDIINLPPKIVTNFEVGVLLAGMIELLSLLAESSLAHITINNFFYC